MNTIILGSFLLSLIHSILFFRSEVGISAILFCIPAMFFIIYILEKRGKIKSKAAMWLSVPILLLSATYFIFNNTLFRIANFGVIAVLFAIMVVWLTSNELKLKFTLSKILSVVFGPIEFFDDIIKNTRKLFKGKEEDKPKKSQIVKKILIAALISIPLVVVVMALLMSADTVFADMFGGIAEYLEKLLTSEEIFYLILRVGLILILFTYIASFIYNLVEEKTSYSVVEEVGSNHTFAIDKITVNTILTILNVIYLIFSGVQIMYLFARTGVGEDFDFANYARTGFFQLMAVSFINFAILFVTSFIKKDTEKEVKLFDYAKIMKMAMCIFTVVIIFSSFYRMYLYEQEYGYTYLRLLVYFSLITELILMIPTILYLIGEKINLLKTYLIIITGMYIILNYMNIDYVIAKKNIDRYFDDPKENKIDFSYLSINTGTDAIPQIKRLIEAEDVALSANVTYYLNKEKVKLEEKMTWQEYNISKSRAKKMLEDIEEIKEGTVFEDYKRYVTTRYQNDEF